MPRYAIDAEGMYPANIAADVSAERLERFFIKRMAISDGSWFSVRILPYRTLENRINGVVITFSDSTASKRLEAELGAGNDSN